MTNSFYSEEELMKLGLKSVGKDVSISRKVSIYGESNIIIGNNVRIDDFCILSGKITIGNNVHIAAYCGLYGGAYGIVIKDFAGLSSRCVIYAESDDYSGKNMAHPIIPEKFRDVTGGQVVLEKHVIIGTGSSIMPAVHIGEGTAVGGMSFVNTSLEEWGIYVGIPCRKIKIRSKGLLEMEKQFLAEKSNL